MGERGSRRAGTERGPKEWEGRGGVGWGRMYGGSRRGSGAETRSEKKSDGEKIQKVGQRCEVERRVGGTVEGREVGREVREWGLSAPGRNGSPPPVNLEAFK